MRHSSQATAITVTHANTWKAAAVGKVGRGTFCRPFSPPVTSVHLNAISNAICEQASVSSEKYSPRRRNTIAPISAASTVVTITLAASASTSLPSTCSSDTATR
ncbi:hypothetical protein FEP89_05428 [Burkholderia multivorans]|nr:hypothetical protein [Burkholderia multivorans]